MPFLKPTSFQGKLRRQGHSVDIKFIAQIDDDGVLELKIERIPFSREAIDLYKFGKPGQRVDYLTLDGDSDDGWSIHSEKFMVTKSGHSSEVGREIEYQGRCIVAELRRDLDQPAKRSQISWFVRKVRAVHVLSWSGPIGRVDAGGKIDVASDSQYPSGVIQITHPVGEADAEWWSESERFLTHIARVLSFGYDTYLMPLIEQKVHQKKLVWRIIQRGRTAPPFLAPFHEVYMEPIFRRACESFATHRDEVVALDPAIRWLTAQVALWEQRLINAMTALECIIDRTAPEGTRQFMSDKEFKPIKKSLKKFLRESGVPIGMLVKIMDLNRRSIKEQLESLLKDRAIFVDDLPPFWIEKVIKSRNLLVHTGVVPEAISENGVTFEQIVWTREIVTRLILERIGFSGSYCSWLHNHDQYHFPECEKMEVWAAKQGHPPQEAGS